MSNTNLQSLAKDIDGHPLGVHNHSPLDFQKLEGDPGNGGCHLQDYTNAEDKLRDEKNCGIGKVGCEINFNRESFTYQEPRVPEETDAELAALEKRILDMLEEVAE